MDYVVYMHRCKQNGKIYIGKTNDIKRRWRSNGIEYKPGKGEENNRPFWNAIKKYGKRSFIYSCMTLGIKVRDTILRKVATADSYTKNIHEG